MLSSSFRRRVSFDHYDPNPHEKHPPLNCKEQLSPTIKPILKNDLPAQPRSTKDSTLSINTIGNFSLPGSPQAQKSSFSSNNAADHNSLQSSEPSRVHKSPYGGLSDSELLELDSQFNNRTIDFQKSYGFSPTSRLQTNSISNRNKNLIDTHFRNLSPNAILKEYPTKPILTKNSFCFNYTHSKLANNDFSDRFYIVLLSNKSASLSSIDYFLNHIASKGDTLVICCSLSTSILGNDKTEQLESFIEDFTDLILSHIGANDKIGEKPISVTFEFFKSFSYMDEVLNLYQPSVVIVGTANEQTKSTSMTTPERKFISVVLVGEDYRNNRLREWNVPQNTGLNCSQPPVSSISFKLPIEKKGSNSSSYAPSILVNDISYSSQDSMSSTTNLSKMKTNDTTASSLFDNLNETPFLELAKTNSNSSSLQVPPDQQQQQRRRSMLAVLDNDTLSTLNNKHSEQEFAIDDTPEYTTLSAKKQLPLGQTREQQELFSKYERRLSGLNVNIQRKPVDSSSTSKDQVDVKEKSKNKRPKQKGLFGWFK